MVTIYLILEGVLLDKVGLLPGGKCASLDRTVIKPLFLLFHEIFSSI